MQAVIALYILIKMAGEEWRFNPSVLSSKGDRSVHARALLVCDNAHPHIWRKRLINNLSFSVPTFFTMTSW